MLIGLPGFRVMFWYWAQLKYVFLLTSWTGADCPLDKPASALYWQVLLYGCGC